MLLNAQRAKEVSTENNQESIYDHLVKKSNVFRSILLAIESAIECGNTCTFIAVSAEYSHTKFRYYVEYDEMIIKFLKSRGYSVKFKYMDESKKDHYIASEISIDWSND